jgi:hypothetical protein
MVETGVSGTRLAGLQAVLSRLRRNRPPTAEQREFGRLTPGRPMPYPRAAS